jgi:recombinational DNA repair protein (RecF pathway)
MKNNTTKHPICKKGTKTMNTYRIEMTPENIFIRNKCVLCGNEYDPGEMRFTLYENDQRKGDICPECSSPTKAAKRARERAEYLLKIAGQLQRNAGEIENIPASVFQPLKRYAAQSRKVKPF